MSHNLGGMPNDAEFCLEALANLGPKTTGVDGAVIWVAAGEFSGPHAGLGPRVMVVLGDKLTPQELNDAVPVLLSAPPEVAGTLPREVREKVLLFLDGNREVLLRHWRGEIDTFEAGQGLRRV